MQSLDPKYDLHCVMLCSTFMLICCMYKPLTHNSMSALTGEAAQRGNEILSNSVRGSLQHIDNLAVVILVKQKLKD